jgi:hypothetical protein
MNAKITSLFAGIALLAGVGIANAEERLTAASMDNVTAAGGYDSLHVWKTVWVDVNIDGNLAHSTATASCSGHECVAQIGQATSTSDYSAYASGFSLSATE